MIDLDQCRSDLQGMLEKAVMRLGSNNSLFKRLQNN
jgi:hypothetical protein